MMAMQVADKAKTKQIQEKSSSKVSTKNMDSMKMETGLMTSMESRINKPVLSVTEAMNIETELKTSLESENIKPVPNATEADMIVDKIVAVARISGSVKYLVKWKDSKFIDLLSIDEVTLICPDLVINFYEQRISWTPVTMELTINLFKAL